MIEALITGKLIRDPVTAAGKSGKQFTRFMLSAHIKDGEPAFISGIAFEAVADRIARLHKGDALAVVGELSPSAWTDRDGVERHGLNVVASAALSAYDAKKRRGGGDGQG